MSKKKKQSLSKRENRLFFVYISPWLIGFTAFTIIPMILSLIYSFTDVRMANANSAPLNFIGLENYISIFTKDKDFQRAIVNTFVFAITKVAIGTFLSLLIAILLNQKVIGKKFFRTLIYLPAVIPVVSVALLWKLIFTGGEMNIANFFLSYLGFAPVNFFGSESSAMLTVILVSVWSGLGPTMLIFLAALQNISQDIIEASNLDGAGVMAKFRHILLPSISSTTFFIIITGLIGSLQAYAEVKLLTDGGPGIGTVTMNLLIVRNAFNTLGKKTLGYASAQGWIVFFIVFIFTLIFFKASQKKVHYGG